VIKLNKILSLEQMKRMSSDEIANAYRNGYRLSDSPINTGCRTCGDNITGLDLATLNPASCPPSIIQGTTKTLSLTVTTAGTPSYTLKFYVGNVLKTITPAWSGNTVTWSWIFNEPVGSHVYAAEVTDSCATGIKTSNRDTCTISVIMACINPVVVLTIPT